MSLVMEMAIALSIRDMISGQLESIKSNFREFEGVTNDVKKSLND